MTCVLVFDNHTFDRVERFATPAEARAYSRGIDASGNEAVLAWVWPDEEEELREHFGGVFQRYAPEMEKAIAAARECES
jgi:hypothetical protein